MTLGMIARCDPGGLSTITAEAFRHLCPSRTLLLDAHRGACNEGLYVNDESRQQVLWQPFDGAISDRTAEWIAGAGIDVLWSAETFYDDRIMRAARGAKVQTAVLAMPELAPWATSAPNRAATLKPDRILVPTGWRLDTLPGAEVLPVPVARDRLRPTMRREVGHVYHLTGAAMLDRNGTRLLLDALPLMAEVCRVTIRAERPVTVPPCGHDVTVVRDQVLNYWDAYPADTDLLVLPRRYGGLSLPVQECASLGVPAVMLRPDPYAGLPFVFSIDAPRCSYAPGGMKGAARNGCSPVPVYDADPRELAAMLDALIREPGQVARASAEANAWAERHAWDGPLSSRWCDALAADCGSMAA